MHMLPFGPFCCSFINRDVNESNEERRKGWILQEWEFTRVPVKVKV